MRERRFLVPDLGEGPDVEIGGDEAHHLIHVLRLTPGDEIVLFDGRGHEVRARVTALGRTTARAQKLTAPPSAEPSAHPPLGVGPQRSIHGESPLDLTLAVAMPKAEAFALVVQKATELGARRIIPVLTARTTLAARHQATSKMVRFRRVAAEACKQCGRSSVPQVEEPRVFESLAEIQGVKLLATPGGGRLPERPADDRCLVAVGPEGGWLPAEIAFAREAGFHLLRLGPRTLRTETAAVAVTFLLEWAWGDGAEE